MKKKDNPQARFFKSSAKLLGGLFVIAWIFFSVNEITGGEVSGLSYLLPGLLMLILMLVALRSSFIGGVALLMTGTALAIWVYRGAPEGVNIWKSALLIGGPYILMGVLFILVGVFERKKPKQ